MSSDVRAEYVDPTAMALGSHRDADVSIPLVVTMGTEIR